MRPFFRRHFGGMFWLCWLLLIVAASLETLLAWPDWAVGLVIVPLNGISWPAFLAYRQAERDGCPTWPLVRRASAAQVAATAVLPLVYWFL